MKICVDKRAHYTIFICFFVLSINEANTNQLTLLSTTAILATLGSAIATIGSTFQADLKERIETNRDILIHDIYTNSINRWRRWPFLKRTSNMKLLDSSRLITNLSNQKFKFDVGTHIIEIELPTVQEDYFDLPVGKNIMPLFRYNKAASTFLSKKNTESNSEEERKKV